MSDLGRFLRENNGSIILFLCLIACLLYYFICKRWRHNRADPPLPPPPPSTWLASAVTIALPRDTGLSQLTINALPTYEYNGGSKEDDGMTPSTICLSPVMEGEMITLLPGCKHAFHVGCINRWLHSQSLCPLCRATARPPELCRDPAAVMV